MLCCPEVGGHFLVPLLQGQWSAQRLMKEKKATFGFRRASEPQILCFLRAHRFWQSWEGDSSHKRGPASPRASLGFLLFLHLIVTLEFSLHCLSPKNPLKRKERGGWRRGPPSSHIRGLPEVSFCHFGVWTPGCPDPSDLFKNPNEWMLASYPGPSKASMVSASFHILDYSQFPPLYLLSPLPRNVCLFSLIPLGPTTFWVPAHSQANQGVCAHLSGYHVRTCMWGWGRGGGICSRSPFFPPNPKKDEYLFRKWGNKNIQE